MFKNKKIVLGIILILITISLLIGISMSNKNIIQKQVKEAEKLTETNQDNSYITTADHLAEVNASVAKLTEFKSKIATALTESGLETSDSADADTMANNIRSISGTSSADKKSGLVFFGGMFHKSYVTSPNYTYSFSDKIYDSNIVSFSSNVITFLESGKHKLTFMKGQINTSFNVRVVINDTTMHTFTFSTSAMISEYEFSVNKGDTLILKIDHSDTTVGWYDSAVLIE